MTDGTKEDLRLHTARRVRAARERLSMTQEQMAEYLRVSQGAVAKWETGRRIPPGQVFAAIAALLPEQERAWWFARAGIKQRSEYSIPDDIRQIPLLRDAIAAGTPRAIDDESIEDMLVFPRRWLPPGGNIVAIRVLGDSMSPIINDGYIVLIDTSQRDMRKLAGKMVAARDGEGVMIKWLRRDRDLYILVPHHVSPRIPVRVIRDTEDWGIVGVVLKWIGEPPPARK